MNRDDDFIAQLEDYLDTYEGVVPLPASVRDAVNARLPETRQVRGAVGPERMLDMASRLSAPARWGIGIAAVLVILVGAAALVPRGAVPGIGASPTPAASPKASPSSSSGSIPLDEARTVASCGDGTGDRCLPAGSYQLSSPAWPEAISFEVPEGWHPYMPAADTQALLVESGPTAPDGSGWGLMFMRVGEVSKDPCDSTAGTLPPEVTATVDGLVAAMRSWPGFVVSDAQPIVVDGHAGQLVTVTSTRTRMDCAAQTTWTTPSGSKMDAYPMVGYTDKAGTGTFRILDLDGTLVLIRSTDFGDPSPHELNQGVKPDPTRHSADQVEMQGIIDSIRFGS